MSKFITNLNEYMARNKLKQNFLVAVTGMDKTKISRILTEKQSITHEEMQLIAEALGKTVSYFLQEKLDFNMPNNPEETLAFSMGHPDSEIIELANKTLDLLEHFDSILGIEDKLNKQNLGVAEYDF